MGFGGIDEEYTLREKARFVVLPVPYDLTSTYVGGARRGPAAIIEASCNMELYDEELDTETYRSGIHTLPPLEIDARGPESMVACVQEAVSGIARRETIPVVLGGEHSISLGCVQALHGLYPDLAVVQLDAHADLRDTYQETPFSHACVGRRIREICPLVQAGIRSMSAEEAAYLKTGQVCCVTARQIREDRKAWNDLLAGIGGNVYLTVDLDVFDPSLMPATGTPEPGGLFWEDVLRLVRDVTRRATVRGFDVVELAPLPGMVAPDFMAARLVYRIMGYVQAPGERRAGQ